MARPIPVRAKHVPNFCFFDCCVLDRERPGRLTLIHDNLYQCDACLTYVKHVGPDWADDQTSGTIRFIESEH